MIEITAFNDTAFNLLIYIYMYIIILSVTWNVTKK